MKTIFRIGIALALVASFLLSSCSEGKTKKRTEAELIEEYGAECVELTKKASKLMSKLDTYKAVGQSEATIQEAKNDTIRKALGLLDEAVKANPKYPNAYQLKGECYAKLKDYEQAISNLKQCEKLLPKAEQGTLYFSEALLEYQRGQKAEMTKLFEKSLQINNEILAGNPYDLKAIAEKAYLLSILGLKDKAQKFLDSYKDNSKVDQKSLNFFREAIKTKHLISKLASDI